MEHPLLQVETYISDAQLAPALDLLRQVLVLSQSDYYNEILLLQARYAKLLSQQRKGILSQAESDLEYNRITDSLLAVKDELRKHDASFSTYTSLQQYLDQSAAKFNIIYSQRLKEAVLRRMTFVKEMRIPFTVLWIDDKPAYIASELAILRSIGIEFQLAASSAAGRAILDQQAIDLIISDVGREQKRRAGFEFAEALVADESQVPMVIYTIFRDPTYLLPPNIFGIALQPDELIHYVLDVMERKL